MQEFLVNNAVLISQIVLVVAVLFVIRTTTRMKKASGKVCPSCGAALPASRLPSNLYEVFVGGWTCPKCHAKLTHDLRVRS